MSQKKSHHAGGWGALKASLGKVSQEKGGLRTLSSLLQVNQAEGFDCPGCAWPEPRERGRFEFCENGVKAVAAETTGKRAGRELFAHYSVTELLEKSDFWLEDQGRLTEPMRYNPDTDHYEPVGWDEAFAGIGQVLRELASPGEAVFYTSGRTSNEAAFCYQLFGRMYGTNNFPDCSNMCHESSGVALTESIGIGKGTVSIDDFEQADAIFIIGQNPGTNHPRMLSELQKASRRGAEIVTINPLVERGLERFMHPKDPVAMMTGRSTPITTLYLQPLVGGDLAALKGMIKCVLAVGDLLDQAFIDEHTSGFDALVEDIEQTGWEVIERESGLSRADIERAAGVYLKAERVIACWAMGLTQIKHAVATIQYVVNLLLLRGNLGRPGAGVCPVRGHSNVQGDRTVGITEKPKPEFLERLGQQFGFAPPEAPGLDTVAAIKAMAEGKAKVFFGMGGNFTRATPDAAYTEAALRRCRLVANVATKLNRGHLVLGEQGYLLPCLGRTERDNQSSGPQTVTVENSMGVVHGSTGKNTPASPHLLSEPAIVAGLAKATLTDSSIDWDAMVADYGMIRDHIEAVISGFEDYNARIRNKGGFALRNSAREREWRTETGRARFMTAELPALALPENQLRLTTIRSHDQYNTTIYGMDDRYRGVKGTRMVVFLNPQDLAARDLSDGDSVDLVSHFADGISRRAEGFRAIAYNIPRGCAAAYFPETNVLVSVNSVADRSHTPTSKFVPITVHRCGQS